MRWLTRILRGLLAMGAGLAAMPTGVTAQPASVTFAAAGDLGATDSTRASLAALAASGAGFYLALGDLSYGANGTEAAWCDLVKSYVTPAFPFELVAGNHEDDAHANGFIDSFAACLPDRMGAVGRYGAEYYFDAGGLVRVIMIAPDLQIGGESYRYVPGNSHYDWLVARIDEARAAGLPWVVVGMHKVCITAGVKTCEIGTDLLDVLIAKRVDLVLHGHEHTYQRSKQLICAFANHFESSCVANDGAAGRYAKGAGTVFVIAGVFGRSLYVLSPADPEAPYFSRGMGLNIDPTFGFVKVTVTATELSAEFVAASGGAFTDHFTIEPASEFALVLGLALDASTVHAGDTLSANLSAANPGPGGFVDLFLGAVLPAEAGPGLGCPAGDAVAFVADAFTRIVLACLSASPATFPPLFRDVPVPAVLPPTAFPGFFSQPVPPGLPVGPYRLFVAATPPGAFLDLTVGSGDVWALATAGFTIVP